jgi:STE24 endopeptidase
MFLFVFLLSNCLQIFLYLLNLYSVRNNNKIPEIFKDTLNKEEFEKSRQYTIDKIKLKILEIAIKTFITIFLLIYIWPIIESLTYKIISEAIPGGILFFLLIGALYYIIDLPFQYYLTFVIETKYQFNKSSLRLFLYDQMKSILITAILGLIVIFAFLGTANMTSTWWIPASFLGILLIIIIQIVSPLMIPLFNKLKPIENQMLKEKIEQIARKNGLSLSTIFIIDQSRRSLHTNAFFSGIGKSKRLILFDTLLKINSEDEILAVFAHETGHYVKKHIIKLFFINSLIFVITIFFFFVLVNSQFIYIAFRVNALYSVALYAAIFIGSIISLLEFVYNSISRKFEYEADRIATDATSREIMINVLKKLAKSNLSNLYPHPLFVFFKYSHPAPIDRIKAIIKD